MLNISDVVVKKVLRKLKTLGILADNAGSVLFVLFAMYENNIKALDAFDDENKEKRAILVYKDLELKGLIQPAASDIHFELTAIGFDLIEWIKREYQSQDRPVEAATETFEEVAILEAVDDWTQSFINLWPAKAPEGYFFRQDKESIKRKLQRFMNKYPYTKDEIMAAAKAYLEDRYKVGYAYTKKVSNFISYRDKTNHDNESSDLAAWCEYIKSEKAANREPAKPSSGFDEFIIFDAQ